MKLYTRFFLVCIILISLSTCQSSYNISSKEGFVEVDGGKMWYRILGEGQGTPMLMMHGGPGGTSRSFYHFASLSKDRPIILFDQFGSGRSDHHKDTSLLKVDYFVEQVAALRSELKLDEVILYGHSWGTALALEYYTKYPKGVKAIIFNSPYFNTAIWEKDADTLISFLPDSIQSAIEIGENTGDFESRSYQIANMVYAKNYGLRKKRLSSKLDTVAASGNYFIYNYMWGPTEFTATGTLKTYDNMYNLKKVNVPTLFITGEYDEARPQTIQYFQTLVPGSETAIIKGAGHATMHDNLSQNKKVIEQFLNKVEND